MRLWPCQCGHAVEEHGHDPRYPGNTGCTICGCLAYEADVDGDDEEPPAGEGEGGSVLRCHGGKHDGVC